MFYQKGLNDSPFLILSAAIGLFVTAFSSFGAQIDPDGGPATEWLELMEELQEDIQDESDSAESSPFILSPVGADVDNNRALSEAVHFNHHQPDGLIEAREFRYSTPRDFANRADRSVNLWLVFHGMHGSSASMHRFFKKVARDAPTVIVYPQALCVSFDNIVDPHPDVNCSTADLPEPNTKWRVISKPGHASDANAFRDIAFVDWLVSELLEHNSQLNPNKVYVSGFSSGASISWMLLCYRSQPFQGFAMHSGQLGFFREKGGCGDGQLKEGTDKRTGYEKLTGLAPDQYGYHAILSPGTLGSVGTIQTEPTKAVFFSYGTADDKLVRNGEPGCWKGRPPDPSHADECTIDEDPLYSMDYGGLLEDRDDISSVHWLLNRHQLALDSEQLCTIVDANPHDNVTTRSHYYPVPSVTGSFTAAEGEPILWHEMEGAGHSMDFNAALHAKSFFENHAGMFRANQPSGTELAVGASCLVSQPEWL